MVLSNINLTIKKGEKVAIMGENGAGKTTLIKHFNGLLKPVKGEVRILGYDTRRTPVSTLARHVGIVFQNPDHQLFAESVEDEIAFALRNFGFPEEVVRKRTEWALNVMDLTRYRKTSPFLLSGGERKRVAIASVLSYNPEIIIFDEPTTGQDYFQKQKIAQLLKLLSLQNKTVIVVTHDVEFAVENFEKIIVMARGRIIAEGTPEDIFNDMKVLKTARLLPPQVTECAIKLKRYLPRIRTQVTKVEDLFSEIIKYC
ncbi:MAG: ABC transporter ATP-binding protein [Thermoprotei archaeon]|nr:MAG: ABC transporter ATP-binding protein [Thermoprotei archaeon]